MAFVIGGMPANLHLVLATRSDPTLPLARLRASGELVEMRSDDYVSGLLRRTICRTMCSGWTWPRQIFNCCIDAPKGGRPASTLPPSRLPGVLMAPRSSGRSPAITVISSIT